MLRIALSVFCLSLFLASTLPAGEASWDFSDPETWMESFSGGEGVRQESGGVSVESGEGTILTSLQAFEEKRSPSSVTVSQSPIWQNWNPIENLGPSNLRDAPVLLTLGPDNYWIFGRYGNGQQRGKKGEKAIPLPKLEAQPATLEGFDVPLQTTRFENVYDAPGGLKPGKGGYHAFQSRDMKTWVHHGPVTEGFSRWVTN
ncbi:MAG: hypothetical protein AAF491_06665, partial [Verrucomicrobiota bacterium]